MKIPDTIKNPLTLLAVFAGLSEVSMVGSLTALPLEIQKVFMWFVIFYPVFLTGGFFYFLHCKPTSFYGPSDYKDDETYLKILQENERQILQKYPIEKSIHTDTEDMSIEVPDRILLKNPDLGRFMDNRFYIYLKKVVGLDHNHITSAIIDCDSPECFQRRIKEISGSFAAVQIMKVFTEFPSSIDDYNSLKQMMLEGDK